MPKKATPTKTAEQPVKTKPAPKPYTPQYGVIILCDGESHQEEVYNKMKEKGYKCKIVTA